MHADKGKHSPSRPGGSRYGGAGSMSTWRKKMLAKDAMWPSRRPDTYNKTQILLSLTEFSAVPRLLVSAVSQTIVRFASTLWSILSCQLALLQCALPQLWCTSSFELELSQSPPPAPPHVQHFRQIIHAYLICNSLYPALNTAAFPSTALADSGCCHLIDETFCASCCLASKLHVLHCFCCCSQAACLCSSAP